MGFSTKIPFFGRIGGNPPHGNSQKKLSGILGYTPPPLNGKNLLVIFFRFSNPHVSHCNSEPEPLYMPVIKGVKTQWALGSVLMKELYLAKNSDILQS